MPPLLMLIDLVTLRPYWGAWRFADAKVLIVGGVPGIALGALLFQVVDADIFRLMIGAVSLVFVLWSILPTHILAEDHNPHWPTGSGCCWDPLRALPVFWRMPVGHWRRFSCCRDQPEKRNIKRPPCWCSGYLISLSFSAILGLV